MTMTVQPMYHNNKFIMQSKLYQPLICQQTCQGAKDSEASDKFEQVSAGLIHKTLDYQQIIMKVTITLFILTIPVK